jgi:hypothetical protein
MYQRLNYLTLINHNSLFNLATYHYANTGLYQCIIFYMLFYVNAHWNQLTSFQFVILISTHEYVNVNACLINVLRTFTLVYHILDWEYREGRGTQAEQSIMCVTYTNNVVLWSELHTQNIIWCTKKLLYFVYDAPVVLQQCLYAQRPRSFTLPASLCFSYWMIYEVISKTNYKHQISQKP